MPTALATALVFLTRLPIEVKETVALKDAAWAFPLVGALVGGVGGVALMAGAELGLHPLACAFIGLAAMALLTGGLHQDGLADVADGFGGGGDKARKLEIMRDSRIGSYGVLALILVVGAEAAILSGMFGAGTAALALIAAGALSRGVLPGLMAWLPHAREDGLSTLAGRPGRPQAAIAAALGLGFVLLPVWNEAEGARELLRALLACGFAATVAALGLGGLARRQIGGQTGDVLGAAQQVTELFVLIAIGSWLST